MATSHHLFFSSFKKSLLLLVFISCFLGSHAKIEDYSYHTIQISSFLPSFVCSPPKDSMKKEPSTLEVIHQHGPCSKLNKDKPTPMPLKAILSNDQSRVNSIHARLNPTTVTTSDQIMGRKVNLPVQSGNNLGSGDYIVSVGLGTPKKTLSLVFDTGSDLTWTQCQPCAVSCYSQRDRIFDPKTSSSYRNISCASTECSQLSSATGNTPGCSSGTCVYAIGYGDQSFSVGFFVKDTLTLSRDVFPGFEFGCGQNNQGLFGQTAGIIGLGRDPVSMMSQTAAVYGRYFSYCLPVSPSSTGHLTLGKAGASTANMLFTPFDSLRGTGYYFITMVSIAVGGQDLAIDPAVFTAAGTVIDSGTVITRLPPAAYAALNTAFKAGMQTYPTAPAYSILDTCFDFSNYTTTGIYVPTVSITFGGGVKVNMVAAGILFFVSPTQGCLAFVANNNDTDIGVYGNRQQLSFEVAYDVAGGQLGFAPSGC